MANEKRLIDANALRKNIDYCEIDTFNDKFTIVEQIKEAPTVDAVEVVRCKDCIYAQKNYLVHGLCLCEKPMHHVVHGDRPKMHLWVRTISVPTEKGKSNEPVISVWVQSSYRSRGNG